MHALLLAALAALAAPDTAEGPLRRVEKPLRTQVASEAPVRVVMEVDPPAASRQAAAEAATHPGVEVEVVVDGLVQLSAPGTVLVKLAEVEGVTRVRPPFHAIEAEFVSEGVDALFLNGLSDWSALPHELTGAGVKIAVLDTGFWAYDILLGTELPDNVTVSCHRVADMPNCDNITGHGTRVAQIIHDIAPEAELHFFGAWYSAEWQAATDEIAAGDFDIVTSSMGFGNYYPLNGTHEFAAKVDDVVAATGAVWFNAAGNQNIHTWTGILTDSNGDGLLEMGGDDNLPIGTSGYLDPADPSPDAVSVDVRWEDTWDPSDNDIDLEVVDDTGTPCTFGGGDWTGDDPQNGTNGDNPWERITCTVPSDSGAFLKLHEMGGLAEGRRVWIVSYYPLEQSLWTNSRSLFMPADAASAVAVGAVGWGAADFGAIRVYSGRGPTDDGRIKPDLVGPASVTIADLVDPALPYNPPIGFGGTSSATPHMAGVAALILEDSSKTLSWTELVDWLILWSDDLGDLGKDNKYGDGVPQLDLTWSEDTDTDTDTDSDSDTDTDTDTDSDTDTDTDTDSDADTDSDSDTDSDTDSDADTDADSDSDADTDADTDSDSDADTDSDTDSDSDTDTDTGEEEPGDCGCNTSVPASGWMLFAAFPLLFRRRQ
jgi:hypothetical protein